MQKEIPLSAGTCQADISPSLPVALVGQYYERMATKIFSPLMATALAVESVYADGTDSMIIVSCDLLGIPQKLMPVVRQKVGAIDSTIDTSKIIINATHTHTGPYIYSDTASSLWGPDFAFTSSLAEEQNPEAYGEFLATAVAQAIADAWKNRRPVRMATGYDYLTLAYNRRIVYQDGHAEMYGSTGRPDFKQVEGSTDSGIHFMVFTDLSGDLTAVAINIPCPSQILEHNYFVSADFWHDVRNEIHRIYGDHVAVIALTGAAGDLSPRDLVRLAREEALLHSTTMYNIEGVHIISRRIVNALGDFWAKKQFEPDDVALHHSARFLEIPLRMTTEEDANASKAAYSVLRSRHPDISSFTENECMWLSIHAGCIKRYEMQQQRTTIPIEVHCIKFGTALIATNPFELFVHYADRIRSGSGCENTFVVQLACGYEGYLPTQEAIGHGGYSSYICNGSIGSDGGEVLVNETLNCLANLNSS